MLRGAEIRARERALATIGAGLDGGRLGGGSSPDGVEDRGLQSAQGFPGQIQLPQTLLQSRLLSRLRRHSTSPGEPGAGAKRASSTAWSVPAGGASCPSVLTREEVKSAVGSPEDCQEDARSRSAGWKWIGPPPLCPGQEVSLRRNGMGVAVRLPRAGAFDRPALGNPPPPSSP